MEAKKRIYLASPYTHDQSVVRQARYQAAERVAAHLMRKGLIVFSPIVHSHLLAEDYDLPQSLDFWLPWCLSYIRHWATDLYVLKLGDWRESSGVGAEIKLARELCLPITYIEECDYGTHD